ncbi:MAG: hypothetical protein RID07_07285, partial [Lacipirellulaceae bacterium]
MSVACVSEDIRNDFMRLWTPQTANKRSAIISDCDLIYWHPFEALYVGLATYREKYEWSPKEFEVHVKEEEQRWASIRKHRTWW